jgi:hypothetical protein
MGQAEANAGSNAPSSGPKEARCRGGVVFGDDGGRRKCGDMGGSARVGGCARIEEHHVFAIRGKRKRAQAREGAGARNGLMVERKPSRGDIARHVAMCQITLVGITRRRT